MPNHSCIFLIRPTCLRCCGLMLPGPALRRQKCALGVSQRLFTARLHVAVTAHRGVIPLRHYFFLAERSLLRLHILRDDKGARFNWV